MASGVAASSSALAKAGSQSVECQNHSHIKKIQVLKETNVMCQPMGKISLFFHNNDLLMQFDGKKIEGFGDLSPTCIAKISRKREVYETIQTVLEPELEIFFVELGHKDSVRDSVLNLIPPEDHKEDRSQKSHSQGKYSVSKLHQDPKQEMSQERHPFNRTDKAIALIAKHYGIALQKDLN